MHQQKKHYMFKTIISAILLFGLSVPMFGQINKIMTINIRYDNPNDGINKWNNRKVELIALIEYYEPEIFGIQEGLIHQVKYLEEHLDNYSRIGVGRDDGKDIGEFSAIYYNHNKVTLIKGSTFWLSETSDQVSVGWDASMERICTYGLFEDKATGEELLIFNAHYDHMGEQAKAESSKVILKKIQKLNDADRPVILMGDFNALPDEEPIKIIMDAFDDGSTQTKGGIYGPKGTYTGFIENAIAEKRIDYIFSKNLAVKKYRHLDDKMKNNNYISDHLPVLIELE